MLDALGPSVLCILWHGENPELRPSLGRRARNLNLVGFRGRRERKMGGRDIEREKERGRQSRAQSLRMMFFRARVCFFFLLVGGWVGGCVCMCVCVYVCVWLYAYVIACCALRGCMLAASPRAMPC